MGTRFNSLQKSIFDAKDGAYSVITSKDEATKGQITLTENEIDVVEEWFTKANIYVGKVKEGGAKARKTFLNFNTGTLADLALVYPKADKPGELRLYMNAGKGFNPSANDVWFVYAPNKGSNLVVGWMDPYSWENLGAKDDEDAAYQDDVQNTAPPMPTTTTTTGYARNRKVALTRMAAAGFKCEVDATHKTFISPATGNNFVEPHHLVPMKGQPDFSVKLDIEENISVLCPNCHRAIHLASRADKLHLLKMFYDKHIPLLSSKGINISFDDLLTYYNL